MSDAYKTVAEAGEAAFEIQKSKFIGHVRPIETVEEAEAFLAEMDATYPDATHNVPAYRIRDGEFLREYENDDTEPSGSAGKPALNVLQGRDLENVAVVVTRYHGGPNLGVGGLVSSYSKATKEAIDAAGVVEKRPHERFSVRVEYDDSGTVRGVLESAGVSFDADYDERVTFEVDVPAVDATALRDRLQSATSGRVEIE